VASSIVRVTLSTSSYATPGRIPVADTVSHGPPALKTLVMSSAGSGAGTIPRENYNRLLPDAAILRAHSVADRFGERTEASRLPAHRLVR